ncbi:hypothetical protein JB92DRAFT_3132197 [Gautieria morchelliformis]|nr:hypothetical protein JB92DRAFT_3132197 [Gautieria morchelliformis]
MFYGNYHDNAADWLQELECFCIERNWDTSKKLQYFGIRKAVCEPAGYWWKGNYKDSDATWAEVKCAFHAIWPQKEHVPTQTNQRATNESRPTIEDEVERKMEKAKLWAESENARAADGAPDVQDQVMSVTQNQERGRRTSPAELESVRGDSSNQR